MTASPCLENGRHVSLGIPPPPPLQMGPALRRCVWTRTWRRPARPACRGAARTGPPRRRRPSWCTAAPSRPAGATRSATPGARACAAGARASAATRTGRSTRPTPPTPTTSSSGKSSWRRGASTTTSKCPCASTALWELGWGGVDVWLHYASLIFICLGILSLSTQGMFIMYKYPGAPCRAHDLVDEDEKEGPAQKDANGGSADAKAQE